VNRSSVIQFVTQQAEFVSVLQCAWWRQPGDA